MSVWHDWKRTTRFVKSTLHALDLEEVRIRAIGGDPTAELVLPSSTRLYRVSVAKHLAAISDRHVLFAFALVFSYGSAEQAARAALSPTIGRKESIESWGRRLLKRNGKTWADVLGEESGLAEVAIVRNAVAHGLTIDQTMLNRLKGSTASWKVGDTVVLTAAALETYRARLRSLLRLSGIK